MLKAECREDPRSADSQGRGFKLAIDAVGAKHSGAARVALALVEAALAHRSVGQIVVYSSPESLRRFNFPSSDRLAVLEIERAEAGPVGRLWWLSRGLPGALRAWRPHAALFLSGVGVSPRRTRGVLFLQQSLPFSSEGRAVLPGRDRFRIAVMRQLMRWSVARATVVVVQSETMKKAVIRDFSADAGRVHVVKPCDTLTAEVARDCPELEAMRQSGVADRLLYVGNTSKYKNLERLMVALTIARRQKPGLQLFASIEPSHELARQPGVVAMGHLGPGSLEEAYRLATVLVMPSLAETVGLPMLEAMASGTPVVAADRPYAWEVCGNAGLFFDPFSPEDMAEKLVRAVSSPDLRSTMASRGAALARERRGTDPYGTLVDIVLGTGLYAGVGKGEM